MIIGARVASWWWGSSRTLKLSQTSQHQFPVTGLHLHKLYWDSGFNTWIWGYIETYRPPHKLQPKAFLLRENPVFRGLWRRWSFTRQTEWPELDSICIPQDERPWRTPVIFQPPQRAAEKSFFNHLIIAVLSSAASAGSFLSIWYEPRHIWKGAVLTEKVPPYRSSRNTN